MGHLIRHPEGHTPQSFLADREECDPDDVLKTKTFGRSAFYYLPIFLCSNSEIFFFLHDIHGEVNFFLYC